MPADQHFDDERLEQDADIEAEREHEVVEARVKATREAVKEWPAKAQA